MKLWIDDVREPPDEEIWLWAKTSEEALTILNTQRIDFIAFDFDLGGDDTAYRVAEYIENCARIGVQPPGWSIHSANPVGRVRLRGALENAETLWRKYVRQKSSLQA